MSFSRHAGLTHEFCICNHSDTGYGVKPKEVAMILLTGATGVAGSAITNEFVAQREPVQILVRNRAKAKWLEKVPTVEVVEGDMSSRSSLASVLDGVDRVLMISAPLMDMVKTQSTFIDACKAKGVRHVIKFSGLDARPDTRFPFGLMHLEIENTSKNPASRGPICARLVLCKNICAKRRASSTRVHSTWRSAT